MEKFFDTYVIKAAGRCNLDCSYCYMYKLADQTWTQQPRIMSEPVIEALALRIAEHCGNHSVELVNVSIHGGEPLLMGRKRMQFLIDALRRNLESRAIHLKISIQTNGTLLTPDWAMFFLDNCISVGISLDGPKNIHDNRRYDRARNGTYDRIIENIQKVKLCSSSHDLFRKVLCVIDVRTSASEIFNHLASLGFTDIDFLLPEANYEFLPTGKESFCSTAYGNWLISVFDEWFLRNDPSIQIRTLKIILARIFGQHVGLDSIGGGPVNIVTIETSGEIEPLDAFKSVKHGITKTGVNVVTHSLDEVFENSLVMLQQQSVEDLPKPCQICKHIGICGGGYLPHRYSLAKSFDNPSIYCKDLFLLITHMQKAISEVLRLNQKNHPIVGKPPGMVNPSR